MTVYETDNFKAVSLNMCYTITRNQKDGDSSWDL